MRKIPGPAGGGDSLSSRDGRRSDIIGEQGIGGSNGSPIEQEYAVRYCSLQSWRSMLQAFGAGLELGSFLDLKSCRVADVMEGIYDLRVPKMILLVESATESFDGSWVLRLSDYTGHIEGFICKSSGSGAGTIQGLEALRSKQLLATSNGGGNSNIRNIYQSGESDPNNVSNGYGYSTYKRGFGGDVVQEFPAILVPGSVVVMEKVSMFIGKEKCVRYLNICFDHIVAVFSGQ